MFYIGTKYKTAEELKENVVESLKETIFNNAKNGSIMMQLFRDSIYLWLPTEKNMVQKSELERFANELLVTSKKINRRIELVVHQYQINNNDVKENEIHTYYTSQFQDFLDYVKGIKAKIIQDIPDEEDLFNQVNYGDSSVGVDRL